MRLLRGFLVLANLRWAHAARYRSERLLDESEAALRECERRIALAHALSGRPRISA